MAELIVQSGKHQGKRLILPQDAEIVIGRDEKCQIRLASSDVSRHHCALRQTPEGLLARDLSSRNGTYLNEVLMEEETLLQPGDRLRVGPIVFQVPGAKTDVRSTPGESAERSDPASDDDIAAWLSQEGLAAADGRVAGPGDTTIIPRLTDTESDADADEPVAPPKEPVASVKERETAEKEVPGKEPAPRQFRTVAEEAADIIRRHWEMVRAEQNEE